MDVPKQHKRRASLPLNGTMVPVQSAHLAAEPALDDRHHSTNVHRLLRRDQHLWMGEGDEYTWLVCSTLIDMPASCRSGARRGTLRALPPHPSQTARGWSSTLRLPQSAPSRQRVPAPSMRAGGGRCACPCAAGAKELQRLDADEPCCFCGSATCPLVQQVDGAQRLAATCLRGS